MPRESVRDALLFRERLTVPAWWWVIATLGVAIGGAEVFAGFNWSLVAIVYVALGLPTTAVLLKTGQLTVKVDTAGLHAGGVTLPSTEMAEVKQLSAVDTRRLLGPSADRSAHMVARGYVREAVAIRTPHLPDCPYWLVSSRHPDDLVTALETARRQATNGVSP